MSVLVFSSLLFITSLAAGLLGALTGLGGGVVIVPVLALLFRGRYPIRDRGFHRIRDCDIFRCSGGLRSRRPF